MALTTLFVSATDYTPEVQLNEIGEMSFKGKCYPENSFRFYQPIMDWLTAFLAQPSLPVKVTCSFHLVYFNSSTAKQIFDLLTLLSEQYNRTDVVIRWFYDADNENALEEGEGLVDDFPTLAFELIEIPASADVPPPDVGIAKVTDTMTN
jgi:hypothetical protein